MKDLLEEIALNVVQIKKLLICGSQDGNGTLRVCYVKNALIKKKKALPERKIFASFVVQK